MSNYSVSVRLHCFFSISSHTGIIKERWIQNSRSSSTITALRLCFFVSVATSISMKSSQRCDDTTLLVVSMLHIWHSSTLEEHNRTTGKITVDIGQSGLLQQLENEIYSYVEASDSIRFASVGISVVKIS